MYGYIEKSDIHEFFLHGNTENEFEKYKSHVGQKMNKLRENSLELLCIMISQMSM